jgi:uncharacterized membrane protein YedE/YeeE
MTATDFTPVASLLGGALIGASAVMLMTAQGRIPFILGIVAAPLVVLLATGTAPLPGIEAGIIAGPAIFGIGWGLAGFCPGAALAALTTGGSAAPILVVAMLVGMAGARWLADRPATLAPANQRG